MTANERPVPPPQAVGKGPIRRPVLAATVLTVLTVAAVLLGSLAWGIVQQRLDTAWSALTLTPSPSIPSSDG
ncbi:hypothetical protein GCM10010988_39410 [Cnuibacter physcomitrellae]|uniref:Uncharacterized protein n=1 Tax=Cnuibacter physcomitrellae TaxID=1619308 RepID=A0A1X9LQX8_9MICO|nr:hypothetical protein [Cnuibacter physcomitrellae]ARJ07527.1 hypothetical protein B5808_19185 [Cnuibacter physcomitrellae]GGI42512.1 hypothetical protein GCM10010988_39410 [Cnuibacter physcomitrellae]